MALEVSITSHRLQGPWVTNCPFLWLALPKSIPIIPAKRYFLASWSPFFLSLLQALVKLSQMATEFSSRILKFTFLSFKLKFKVSLFQDDDHCALPFFSSCCYTIREFWCDGFPSTASQVGFVCRWSREAIMPFLLGEDELHPYPLRHQVTSRDLE